MRQVGKNGIYQ